MEGQNNAAVLIVTGPSGAGIAAHFDALARNAAT